MITPGEAEDIVRDCIREVVTNPPTYGAEKPLDAMGIMTNDVLNDFKDEVRNNTEVGVQAYDHTLAAKHLSSVTTETLAGTVEDIISTHAVKASPPADNEEIADMEAKNKDKAKKKKGPAKAGKKGKKKGEGK